MARKKKPEVVLCHCCGKPSKDRDGSPKDYDICWTCIKWGGSGERECSLKDMSKLKVETLEWVHGWNIKSRSGTMNFDFNVSAKTMMELEMDGKVRALRDGNDNEYWELTKDGKDLVKDLRKHGRIKTARQ